MKSLLFASALVAMLASVGTALTPSGSIDIEWSIPLGAVASDASGGGGGMFYAQIDGHSVGYNLTTQLKTFDKEISGGQVQGFLPFDDLVLILTQSGDTLAFDHSGKFLWDSAAFQASPDASQYRRVGHSLFMLPGQYGSHVQNINLLTGEVNKKIQVGSALFGAGSTLYAVVQPSFGASGNTTFSKFSLASGKETVISSNATSFGTLSHVTTTDLAVFIATNDMDVSVAAARSLLTGKIVSKSDPFPQVYNGIAKAFGDVFAYAGNNNVLLASKISDLSKIVTNVSLPTSASGQPPTSFTDGNKALYVFSKGLIQISGQDGTIARTDASITEVPRSKTHVVIDLGAVTMVPNLQGYTLWDSATFAYVGRDETVPPTEYNVYQWNGLYVNILGANLVGWKSTYQ